MSEVLKKKVLHSKLLPCSFQGYYSCTHTQKCNPPDLQLSYLTRCVLRGLTVQRGHPNPRRKELRMSRPQHTPSFVHLEEAVTVLFCLVDDAYALLNPRAKSYESIKRLSDSEIMALSLLQQLRGVESERSFLRDTEWFFAHLFPGVVGLHPRGPRRSRT